MSSIRVNFEIGHEASLKSKKTPEGFTHDWEVFVRGQEGANISHFVEKVVFLLHETFPKPRRVVKEPPFSIKESGYAGFIFPIEIYLKNKDEPKKIKFTYDFTLQQSGFLKDRYIFENPNEEFRKKLLKGGGIPIANNSYYTNPDQESRSRDSFTEEKQLVNIPKLSSESKKQKIKEHKEEVPIRTSNFERLFGPPIQKPPKVSPDPKKAEKNASAKSDKKEKDRSNPEKKSKHEHKEAKAEKLKIKEEKDKIRSDKIKNQMKEQDKSKEKANKRPNERPPTPEAPKKRCLSPIRRVPSPAPRSSSSSSNKEEYKIAKHNLEMPEPKKPKMDEKPIEIKPDKDIKEKKKKEKKSHDRDKERKEKKEHKKENHKLKESPKEVIKEMPKEMPKVKELPKELIKESPIIKEKMPKEKPINKFSIENLRKTPPDIEDRSENIKHKERGESEKKHKHKKKDKKRDESREKHKESNKEKKHKYDKVRELPIEKPEIIERRETPIPKERCIPEPASPISIDTASQCSSKSGLTKPSHIGNDNMNSSHSDSESSVIAEEDDSKVKIENPSPELIKHEPSPEPVPEPEPEPEVEPEPQPIIEPQPQQTKEKSKKHKDKSKREEKRRKRKIFEEEEPENRKTSNPGESGPSYNGIERGESSGSTMFTETKVQDNGVSSSLGEDAEPGDLSPDYMVRLRELQQRIMKIKNNEDLERVVNLIVETGRFEVTTQTFDFDLCLLDRSTVQQLIQLVGC